MDWDDPPPAPTSPAERYRVGRRLGAGSCGEVWLAFDRLLQRDVALKVHTEGSRDRDPRRREFLSGARLAASLDHPNVVPVYDLGVDPDGRAWFTMKHVEGQSLADWIRSRGEAPPDAAFLRAVLETLGRVCEALAFAHDRGVVHNDVNPANVLVGRFGEVFLTDWGGARRLCQPPLDGHTGGGTLGFMAPEQARVVAGPPDPRTDIHGVGACLWFAMTGRPPYPANTVRECLHATATGQFTGLDPAAIDPRVPGALRAVAVAALAVDPGLRFQTASELRGVLARVLAGEAWFERRRFAPGATVVREGEPGQDAYIITQGHATVSSEGVPIRSMVPGDVFGETALLAGGTRTATVTADTELVTLVVSQGSLDAELGAGSWLSVFVRTLAARFRETHEAWVAERAQRRAE